MASLISSASQLSSYAEWANCCAARKASRIPSKVVRYNVAPSMFVLNGPYHGSTTTLTQISPCTADQCGGSERPPWVHIVVRDRTTLQPAAQDVYDVINQMRATGVLVGSDGPLHNVLEIRPPMPFNAETTDMLAHCLNAALTSSAAARSCLE
jgi:hypothetical protein